MDGQPGFLIIFSTLIFVFIMGIVFGTSTERQEAIAAKVAEYSINKTTGETTFQYLTPKLNSEREK